MDNPKEHLAYTIDRLNAEVAECDRQISALIDLENGTSKVAVEAKTAAAQLQMAHDALVDGQLQLLNTVEDQATTARWVSGICIADTVFAVAAVILALGA